MPTEQEKQLADKCNIRQTAFAKAITNTANKLTYGNATQSARVAGYSGNDTFLAITGNRLLSNIKVKALISVLQADVAKVYKHGIKQAYAMLSSLHQRSIADNDKHTEMACIREFNDVAGLHKIQIDDISDQKIELSEQQKIEDKRIAAISLADTA